jgi:PPOX class probable FMN-dependent enzyme
VSPTELVTTEEQLAALYGEPMPVSITKEIDEVSDWHRAFIEASPFVVIGTAGPEGLDCSPRGDPAPVVRVLDEHTLAIPDRRGNNRLDTLRNIVRDPRVALLFLIPGVGETIRVNGTAVIATDDELRASFTHAGKVPASVIVVTVETIYHQCSKAVVRSRLWDPDSHVPRESLPTTGQLMEQLTAGETDGAAYDAAYPERLRATLY